MANGLRSWGIAVLVLGACIFLVPYFGLPAPGGPNLGFYIAIGGAAMWILGRVMKK